MIGNKMKTNKVYNIMIIEPILHIHIQTKVSRPFGESESRERCTTTCDASTLLYCIIIDCIRIVEAERAAVARYTYLAFTWKMEVIGSLLAGVIGNRKCCIHLFIDL